MKFTQRYDAPTNSGYYRGDLLYGTNAYSMWAVGGNCTHYAACRFHEIMGRYDDPSGCQIGYGNAEDWWGNHRGYKSGSVPKLGAILCLKDGPYSGWGHVAIVEQINSDGSIITSESGYQSYIFDRVKRYPPHYNSVGYGFQGFIYNPAVPDDGISSLGQAASAVSASGQVVLTPPQAFVQEAAKHVGAGGHAWVKSQVPSIGNSAWCAATICAVAKVLGFAGIILPREGDSGWAWCQGPSQYTERRGGKHINGPGKGVNSRPEVGDIIVFDWENNNDPDHVGIVEKVVGDIVHTIEGNANGGQYVKRQFNYRDKRIVYYSRPDWSKVGEYALVNEVGALQPLYETKSTRADALLRDVGYFTQKGKPTSAESQIGLSVINYTWLLGPVADAFGGVVSEGVEDGNIDTTGIENTTARGVANYLAAKGLNRAAIAGVMGNIYAESGFRLDAVEMGYPYQGRGLCQWSWERATRLLSRVPNWKHDLEGQMDLLWWELENEYTSVMKTLKSVPDTKSGCYEACKVFVMRFEVPAGYNTAAVWDRRYSYALPYYEKMKPVVKTTTSTTESVGMLKGRSAKQVVVIPATVKQSGILSDYTYYPGISWAYSPKRVYEAWRSRGSKSSNNIATIDDAYLVAVRAGKFGNVGDLLKVTLEGGATFSAIIGDTKSGNDHNSGEWGHQYSSGTSIIEWESVTTNQPALNASLGVLGIYGKKVKSITNYGSYV